MRPPAGRGADFAKCDGRRWRRYRLREGVEVMGRINLNDLARRVALREGKRRGVGIGQVKEVLRVAFEEMALHRPSAVLKVVERHGNMGAYRS